MVDSINGTSSVPNVFSPHTAAKYDAGDSGKAADVKGEELNNRATLSPTETDPADGGEPKTAVENDKSVHQVSESAQNEPPGSRMDILA